MDRTNIFDFFTGETSMEGVKCNENAEENSGDVPKTSPSKNEEKMMNTTLSKLKLLMPNFNKKPTLPCANPVAKCLASTKDTDSEKTEKENSETEGKISRSKCTLGAVKPTSNSDVDGQVEQKPKTLGRKVSTCKRKATVVDKRDILDSAYKLTDSNRVDATAAVDRTHRTVIPDATLLRVDLSESPSSAKRASLRSFTHKKSKKNKTVSKIAACKKARMSESDTQAKKTGDVTGRLVSARDSKTRYELDNKLDNTVESIVSGLNYNESTPAKAQLNMLPTLTNVFLNCNNKLINLKQKATKPIPDEIAHDTDNVICADHDEKLNLDLNKTKKSVTVERSKPVCKLNQHPLIKLQDISHYLKAYIDSHSEKQDDGKNNEEEEMGNDLNHKKEDVAGQGNECICKLTVITAEQEIIDQIGGQLDKPATVRGGQLDNPATVRGGQLDNPATVRGGQLDNPATVRGGQLDQPATVKGGQLDQPITVKQGDVNKDEVDRIEILSDNLHENVVDQTETSILGLLTGEQDIKQTNEQIDTIPLRSLKQDLSEQNINELATNNKEQSLVDGGERCESELRLLNQRQSILYKQKDEQIFESTSVTTSDVDHNEVDIKRLTINIDKCLIDQENKPGEDGESGEPLLAGNTVTDQRTVELMSHINEIIKGNGSITDTIGVDQDSGNNNGIITVLDMEDKNEGCSKSVTIEAMDCGLEGQEGSAGELKPFSVERGTVVHAGSLMNDSTLRASERGVGDQQEGNVSELSSNRSDVSPLDKLINSDIMKTCKQRVNIFERLSFVGDDCFIVEDPGINDGDVSSGVVKQEVKSEIDTEKLATLFSRPLKFMSKAKPSALSNIITRMKRHLGTESIARYSESSSRYSGSIDGYTSAFSDDESNVDDASSSLGDFTENPDESSSESSESSSEEEDAGDDDEQRCCDVIKSAESCVSEVSKSVEVDHEKLVQDAKIQSLTKRLVVMCEPLNMSKINSASARVYIPDYTQSIEIKDRPSTNPPNYSNIVSGDVLGEGISNEYTSTKILDDSLTTTDVFNISSMVNQSENEGESFTPESQTIQRGVVLHGDSLPIIEGESVVMEVTCTLADVIEQVENDVNMNQKVELNSRNISDTDLFCGETGISESYSNCNDDSGKSFNYVEAESESTKKVNVETGLTQKSTVVKAPTLLRKLFVNFDREQRTEPYERKSSDSSEGNDDVTKGGESASSNKLCKHHEKLNKLIVDAHPILVTVELPAQTSGSAFASDNLDEYLNNDENLTISSNIKVNVPSKITALGKSRRDNLSQPNFDDIDGMAFVSFSSENLLKSHVNMETNRNVLSHYNVQRFCALQQRRHFWERNSPAVSDAAAAKAFSGYSKLLNKRAKKFKSQNEPSSVAIPKRCPENFPNKTSDVTKIKGWKNKLNLYDGKSQIGPKLHWKTEERLIRMNKSMEVNSLGFNIKRKRRKNPMYTHRKSSRPVTINRKPEKLQNMASGTSDFRDTCGEIGHSRLNSDFVEKPVEPPVLVKPPPPPPPSPQKLDMPIITEKRARLALVPLIVRWSDNHVPVVKIKVLPPGCTQPGCRYGCVCHLTATPEASPMDDIFAFDDGAFPACQNEHCQLGCVCASLKQSGASRGRHHCRREECMLGCVCGTGKGDGRINLRDRSTRTIDAVTRKALALMFVDEGHGREVKQGRESKQGREVKHEGGNEKRRRRRANKKKLLEEENGEYKIECKRGRKLENQGYIITRKLPSFDHNDQSHAACDKRRTEEGCARFITYARFREEKFALHFRETPEMFGPMTKPISPVDSYDRMSNDSCSRPLSVMSEMDGTAEDAPSSRNDEDDVIYLDDETGDIIDLTVNSQAMSAVRNQGDVVAGVSAVSCTDTKTTQGADISRESIAGVVDAASLNIPACKEGIEARDSQRDKSGVAQGIVSDSEGEDYVIIRNDLSEDDEEERNNAVIDGVTDSETVNEESRNEDSVIVSSTGVESSDNDSPAIQTPHEKKPWHVHMICLTKSAENNLDMSYLLEIRSNCNWIKYRSRVIAKIADNFKRSDVGTKKRVMFYKFIIDIDSGETCDPKDSQYFPFISQGDHVRVIATIQERNRRKREVKLLGEVTDEVDDSPKVKKAALTAMNTRAEGPLSQRVKQPRDDPQLSGVETSVVNLERCTEEAMVLGVDNTPYPTSQPILNANADAKREIKTGSRVVSSGEGADKDTPLKNSRVRAAGENVPQQDGTPGSSQTCDAQTGTISESDEIIDIMSSCDNERGNGANKLSTGVDPRHEKSKKMTSSKKLTALQKTVRSTLETEANKFTPLHRITKTYPLILPRTDKSPALQPPEKLMQHNLLERERRRTLRGSFFELKDVLLTETEISRSCTKITTLNTAISEIRRLEMKKTSIAICLDQLTCKRRRLLNKLWSMQDHFGLPRTLEDSLKKMTAVGCEDVALNVSHEGKTNEELVEQVDSLLNTPHDDVENIGNIPGNDGNIPEYSGNIPENNGDILQMEGILRENNGHTPENENLQEEKNERDIDIMERYNVWKKSQQTREEKSHNRTKSAPDFSASDKNECREVLHTTEPQDNGQLGDGLSDSLKLRLVKQPGSRENYSIDKSPSKSPTTPELAAKSCDADKKSPSRVLVKRKLDDSAENFRDESSGIRLKIIGNNVMTMNDTDSSTSQVAIGNGSTVNDFFQMTGNEEPVDATIDTDRLQTVDETVAMKSPVSSISTDTRCAETDTSTAKLTAKLTSSPIDDLQFMVSVSQQRKEPHVSIVSKRNARMRSLLNDGVAGCVSTVASMTHPRVSSTNYSHCLVSGTFRKQNSYDPVVVYDNITGNKVNGTQESGEDNSSCTQRKSPHKYLQFRDEDRTQPIETTVSHKSHRRKNKASSNEKVSLKDSHSLGKHSTVTTDLYSQFKVTDRRKTAKKKKTIKSAVNSVGLSDVGRRNVTTDGGSYNALTERLNSVVEREILTRVHSLNTKGTLPTSDHSFISNTGTSNTDQYNTKLNTSEPFTQVPKVPASTNNFMATMSDGEENFFITQNYNTDKSNGCEDFAVLSPISVNSDDDVMLDEESNDPSEIIIAGKDGSFVEISDDGRLKPLYNVASGRLSHDVDSSNSNNQGGSNIKEMAASIALLPPVTSYSTGTEKNAKKAKRSLQSKKAEISRDGKGGDHARAAVMATFDPRPSQTESMGVMEDSSGIKSLNSMKPSEPVEVFKHVDASAFNSTLCQPSQMRESVRATEWPGGFTPVAGTHTTGIPLTSTSPMPSAYNSGMSKNEQIIVKSVTNDLAFSRVPTVKQKFHPAHQDVQRMTSLLKHREFSGPHSVRQNNLKHISQAATKQLEAIPPTATREKRLSNRKRPNRSKSRGKAHLASVPPVRAARTDSVTGPGTCVTTNASYTDTSSVKKNESRQMTDYYRYKNDMSLHELSQSLSLPELTFDSTLDENVGALFDDDMDEGVGADTVHNDGSADIFTLLQIT